MLNGARRPGQAVTMDALVLVRHGESVGNLADARARDAGARQLDLDTRDPDTPLSEQGQRQATVLAEHVATAEARSPDVVLSSPYLRAASTARVVAAAVGLEPVWDERLRERDLGIFDGLTSSGIRASHPEEAERRSRLGKFYYRPPGGESWTDVALRVRHLLLELSLTHAGLSVWVFTHQAVIMSFRLALEGLDETTLLALDRTQPLANCSLTRYRGTPGGPLELESFADTRHLDQAAVEATHEAAATEPMAPREGGSHGDR